MAVVHGPEAKDITEAKDIMQNCHTISSDVSGGYSSSMFDAMRMAVVHGPEAKDIMQNCVVLV